MLLQLALRLASARLRRVAGHLDNAADIIKALTSERGDGEAPKPNRDDCTCPSCTLRRLIMARGGIGPMVVVMPGRGNDPFAAASKASDDDSQPN